MKMSQFSYLKGGSATHEVASDGAQYLVFVSNLNGQCYEQFLRPNFDLDPIFKLRTNLEMKIGDHDLSQLSTPGPATELVEDTQTHRYKIYRHKQLSSNYSPSFLMDFLSCDMG